MRHTDVYALRFSPHADTSARRYITLKGNIIECYEEGWDYFEAPLTHLSAAQRWVEGQLSARTLYKSLPASHHAKLTISEEMERFKQLGEDVAKLDNNGDYSRFERLMDERESILQIWRKRAKEGCKLAANALNTIRTARTR